MPWRSRLCRWGVQRTNAVRIEGVQIPYHRDHLRHLQHGPEQIRCPIHLNKEKHCQLCPTQRWKGYTTLFRSGAVVIRLDHHGFHGLLYSPAFHGLRQPVGSILFNYDEIFPIHITVSIRQSFAFVFSFYDGKFPIRISVSVRRSFAFVSSFLRWEIPYSYRSLRLMELCVRLFFLRWEIPYSYCSLHPTEPFVHLLFLRWEIPSLYRSLHSLDLCVRIFPFL